MVVLGGISDNIELGLNTGKYGAISKTYSTTINCYVVNFIFDTMIL